MTVHEIRSLFATVHPGTLALITVADLNRYQHAAAQASLDDEMIEVAKEIDESAALAHIAKLRTAVLCEVKRCLT